LKPWTKMAAAHAQAERLLKEIALPHAVLRMPFVYGVGDRLGLFPRILCAAVYRRLGEKVNINISNFLCCPSPIPSLPAVSRSLEQQPQDAHAARDRCVQSVLACRHALTA